MANHSIDCPYCGQDRRQVFPCCEPAKEEHASRVRAWREEQKDREKLLTRLDIEFRYRNSTLFAGETECLPRIKSLFRFLRGLEDRPSASVSEASVSVTEAPSHRSTEALVSE